MTRIGLSLYRIAPFIVNGPDHVAPWSVDLKRTLPGSNVCRKTTYTVPSAATLICGSNCHSPAVRERHGLGRAPRRAAVARCSEKDRGPGTSITRLRGVDVCDRLIDVGRARVRRDCGFPVRASSRERLFVVERRCRPHRACRGGGRRWRKNEERDDERGTCKINPDGVRLPLAGSVRFLFHASRKFGCLYRTVSRARPPTSIDVHEWGVDPTRRTFVSEGIRRDPPGTGHGRYESNLGRWSRTRRYGRGAPARQPVRSPVVCGVRDANGPPGRDVRRDGEHGARELAPGRTVGMDRLPMARGRGVPRYRDRGRGPQDTAHRDIRDRRLAPVCGPPRGGAALSEPAGIEWHGVGELRLRIRSRRARLCPHRGGRSLATPGACPVRGADDCRVGRDIDPRLGLRIALAHAFSGAPTGSGGCDPPLLGVDPVRPP